MNIHSLISQTWPEANYGFTSQTNQPISEKAKIKVIAHLIQCGLCAAWLLVGYSTLAANGKTYQVSGPVLEVTPTTITVQKGSEKWQINRDAGTKIATEPKVGSKVTIYYTMTATEIDVKGAKGNSA